MWAWSPDSVRPSATCSTPCPPMAGVACWPPNSFGAMKTWTSSICRGVEQRAEKLRAPFDEHVRHPPAAQLVEQLQEPLLMGRRRKRQHFAARVGQPAEILLVGIRAGGHDASGYSRAVRTSWLKLASRASESRTIRVAMRGGAPSSSRAVSSGSSSWAVPRPTRIASTRPRSWWPDLPGGFAGDPLAVAAAGGDLAVERHGPFGDDPGPAGFEQLQIRARSARGPRSSQSPSSTSMPAAARRLSPPPATCGNGIAHRHDDAGQAAPA